MRGGEGLVSTDGRMTRGWEKKKREKKGEEGERGRGRDREKRD